MNKLTAAHSALTLTLGLTCLYLLQERGTPKVQPLSVAAAPARSLATSVSEPTGQTPVAVRDEKPRSGVAAEPAAPEDAPPVVQPRPQTDHSEMERLRLRDPRFRGTQVEAFKLSILSQSPELIARVGYAKAEQIAAIWSETFYPREPLPVSGPELTRLQYIEQHHARDAAVVQRVAEKFGGEVAGEFERFLQQRVATTEVDELRTGLAGSAAALRDDQADNLLSALSQARRTLEREIAEKEEIENAANPVKKAPTRTMAGQLKWAELRIAHAEREAAKLREAAAPYLSKEQMELYDRMLQRKVRSEQLSLEREKVDARIVAARAQQQQTEKGR